MGCGPGRYGLHLTEQGYRVTITDLSAANIEFARGKLHEAGLAAAGLFTADARDLSRLPDASFDAVPEMLGSRRGSSTSCLIGQSIKKDSDERSCGKDGQS